LNRSKAEISPLSNSITTAKNKLISVYPRPTSLKLNSDCMMLITPTLCFPLHGIRWSLLSSLTSSWHQRTTEESIWQFINLQVNHMIRNSRMTTKTLILWISWVSLVVFVWVYILYSTCSINPLLIALIKSKSRKIRIPTSKMNSPTRDYLKCRRK
jgi:hypothetical protein